MENNISDFGKFLKDNGYVLMRTDDENGNMVCTKYYINPSGSICWNTNGGIKFVTSKDRRPSKDGYNWRCFDICGTKMLKTVHRLVAQNFLPNPDNLAWVRYKDGDVTNDNVENLEWATIGETLRQRVRSKRVHIPDYPIARMRRTEDGGREVIEVYNSKKDIPKYLDGVKLDKSMIMACCLKYPYHKSHRGFLWAYEKDI